MKLAAAAYTKAGVELLVLTVQTTKRLRPNAAGVGFYGLPSTAGRRHLALSLAASNCRSSGICRVILLSLLSFSVRMTVSPSSRPAAQAVLADGRVEQDTARLGWPWAVVSFRTA